MTRLALPNKITTSEIDKLFAISDYAKIESADFFFPNIISQQGFGVFPSIITFFFVWLRNNKTGSLIIDLDIDDKTSIENFSTSFLGYTILSSAWKHKEIKNHKGISLKTLFKPYTSKFHTQIDFLENLPNDNVLIPLFDHYSKQQGLSHWFYDGNFNFISSPTELSNTVYRIFEELGKIFKTKLSKTINTIIDDLEIIIWELVKNTHDHATKDYLNRIDLSPNTRGVYLKIHRSSKKNFIANEKNNNGLQTYFKSILEEGDNFLLEISVFDVGPGMTRRFLGKDWNGAISANYEVEIIKKCLCKGTSSTEGLQGDNRGYGLNNVLMTLSNRKGYIKIRTGKISIYRDLLKSPHFETTDYTRVELQDSKTDSPSEFTSTGNTIGTTITMLYPLK